MKPYLIAFLAVFAYKLISNISRFLLADFYINEHLEYLASGKVDITGRQLGMKKLVQTAGVTSTSVPVAQEMGYGQIASFSANVFDNVSSRRENVATVVSQSLKAARGVFKSRIIECFSPLYWIELVVFLPKHVVHYLGGSVNGVVLKLIQLVYWIATPLLILFRSNVYIFIIQFLEQAKYVV